MHDVPRLDGELLMGTPNPSRDMLLAEGAVPYLRGQGLDDQAVIRCLVEEFDIGLEIAESLAYHAAWGEA